MKMITGLVTSEDAFSAIDRLIESGLTYDDLSLMSSAAEMPHELEGEPEESAVSGAVVGAATGGAVGALGASVASTIPGFEGMFLAGMMATATGSVIGAFLGSIYSVRAESQTKIDVHEALSEGEVLLVVRTDGRLVDEAVSALEGVEARDIEVHTIPETEQDGDPG